MQATETVDENYQLHLRSFPMAQQSPTAMMLLYPVLKTGNWHDSLSILSVISDDRWGLMEQQAQRLIELARETRASIETEKREELCAIMTSSPFFAFGFFMLHHDALIKKTRDKAYKLSKFWDEYRLNECFMAKKPSYYDISVFQSVQIAVGMIDRKTRPEIEMINHLIDFSQRYFEHRKSIAEEQIEEQKRATLTM